MRFEYKQNTFCSYIEDNRTGLTYIVTNYNDMKDLVTLLNKQSQQLVDKDKEIERQDKIIREINKSKYDKLMEKDTVFHLKNKNEELEAKLANIEESARAVIDANFRIAEERDKLKQQLAKSETEIKSLSSEISSLEQDLTHYKGEVYNLKDQLAESEKLKDDAFYNYAWLNQEVSDVRQKLKDSEDTYKTLCYNYQNLGKAYNELEQQLAEKDKEIEDIKNTHIYRFYLDKDKVQDVYMTDIMLEVFNQDKISFCIEKLETVKEWLEPKYFDNEQIVYLTKIVDNQIKQLKKRD